MPYDAGGVQPMSLECFCSWLILQLLLALCALLQSASSIGVQWVQICTYAEIKFRSTLHIIRTQVQHTFVSKLEDGQGNVISEADESEDTGL